MLSFCKNSPSIKPKSKIISMANPKFISKFKIEGAPIVKKIDEIAKEYIPSEDSLPIGISEFDNAMDGGIRGGELIVVSGPTGSGKSLWCQNLTINLSETNVPSMWFSYEMNPYYLSQRFKQIDSQKDLLAYGPTTLGCNSLGFLEKHIKEAWQEYACKTIFIDHLHYLIPLRESTSTSLMIGAIVRQLKLLAVKLDVIIFLIAHTKKIYQDEQLNLSSIRDSSLISQESDYVFLIERLKKESKKLEQSGSTWSNQTRISLAKNRRTGKLMYITCNYQNGKLIPVTDQFENYELEPKY